MNDPNIIIKLNEIMEFQYFTAATIIVLVGFVGLLVIILGQNRGEK